MKRWLTYVLERFPFVGYLLICVGLCASTTALLRGRTWTASDLMATSLASFGVLLFLVQDDLHPRRHCKGWHRAAVLGNRGLDGRCGKY